MFPTLNIPYACSTFCLHVHMTFLFQTINSSIYAPCIQICKLIENYSDTGSPIIDFDAFAIPYYRLRNFMESHASNYMDMKNIKGY